eukprot:gnl/Spiro4/5951_TR3046_c0_g3_i1.p1 gnl/Spiro4/5951_TR3046_c0_g3~~gnl/Spiro4/5951_TR3046_c0_g3_i1.p1  ORF type:complete len:256 (+),score=48.88 gnl/Spiro4/5951_TR3046_c0_g3_i1:50-817(+)
MRRLFLSLVVLSLLAISLGEPTFDNPCADANTWFKEDLEFMQDKTVWHKAKKNDITTVFQAHVPGEHSAYPMLKYTTVLNAPVEFIRKVEEDEYAEHSRKWVKQLMGGMSCPLPKGASNEFSPNLFYGVYNFPAPMADRDVCQLTCSRQIDDNTWQSSARTVDPATWCEAANPTPHPHLYERISRLYVKNADDTVSYTFMDQEDAAFNQWMRPIAILFYPGEFSDESLKEKRWIEKHKPKPKSKKEMSFTNLESY